MRSPSIRPIQRITRRYGHPDTAPGPIWVLAPMCRHAARRRFRHVTDSTPAAADSGVRSVRPAIVGARVVLGNDGEAASRRVIARMPLVAMAAVCGASIGSPRRLRIAMQNPGAGHEALFVDERLPGDEVVVVLAPAGEWFDRRHGHRRA